MVQQIPFGTNDFAENPEPRCPCILLLDVSGSMSGKPIDELNAGLVVYKDETCADNLASKRVEVALVTFGGMVQTVCDFTTIDNFQPPQLTASGDTPMGAAIHQAIEMLANRKSQYKANAIAYYRPWIFMITDGGPTDDWKTAADHVKTGEASKAFSFFAVGVEGANFDRLKQISVKTPIHLKGLRFRELFSWLSTSQKTVSHSKPEDAVPLPNPTGPEGWGFV